MKDSNNFLTKILIKKAKGYTVREKTEEYGFKQGEKTLLKKKITTKHVPPDINAVRALMQMGNDEDFTLFSDGELEREKLRLMEILKQNEK